MMIICTFHFSHVLDRLQKICFNPFYVQMECVGHKCEQIVEYFFNKINICNILTYILIVHFRIYILIYIFVRYLFIYS